MRLWAISDLHIGYAKNKQAVQAIDDHGDDWLIVAGDVGETFEQLRWTLDTLGAKFGQLIWVPGNHELWTHKTCESLLRGEARYRALVDICRDRNVLTPEDPYVPWPGDPGLRICPLFVGYDYSFAPEGLQHPDQARAWAREEGIVAMDERLMHPDPHATLEDWCGARVAATERRLSELDAETVLINHWTLRRELVRLPERIQRFVIWCGTRRTEDWHRRFRARVVVTGHLHMRATDWRDGTRFEEVATGYPRHWKVDRGLTSYLREILPGVPPQAEDSSAPRWHR